MERLGNTSWNRDPTSDSRQLAVFHLSSYGFVMVAMRGRTSAAFTPLQSRMIRKAFQKSNTTGRSNNKAP
jgi:hypothetical protein